MISTSNVTMTFGQTTLFEGVTIKFKPGCRYGLIGANGSGKSTFMRILTGQLTPSHGNVFLENDCTLGYLRQDHGEFDEMTILDTVYMGNPQLWKVHQERDYLYSQDNLTEEEETRCFDIEDEYERAGGYLMETEAAKLLAGLGFPETVFTQPMTTLQGGFKLRVLLAQALFGRPDILLLDEPTNHLDMQSIEWLVDFLCGYDGTVIVISHDRFFHGRVISCVICINGVVLYPAT